MYSFIIEAKNYHFKMYVEEYSQHSCTLLPIRPEMKKIFVDTFQIKFDHL